jgi:hypothetical protein
MHTSFSDNEILGKFNDESVEIPLRLQPAPISGALEVAILAQSLPLQAAAELIEQYAKTYAAAAQLDATVATGERCLDIIKNSGEQP